MRKRFGVPLLILGLLFATGCQDDFSTQANPVLIVQVSNATCTNKIEFFNIQIESAGVSGQASPGSMVSFSLTIGNHRLVATSVPEGINHDQVYFVPSDGRTVTLDCP